MSLKKLILIHLFFLAFCAQTSAQDIFSSLSAKHGVINSISISYRQNEIVFTAQNNGRWELYSVEKKGEQWGEPEAITAANDLLQAGENIEGSSFIADGTKLYFSITNLETSTGEIYYLSRKDNKWIEAQKLPEIINSAGLEGSPSVTSDGKTMFFTRPNPDPENDKYDARFIYITEQDDKGNWIRPYKLPKVINTDCEFSPRIMPDGKTLVFSSVRKEVKNGNQVVLAPLGKFDIYTTIRVAEKIWTNPTHLPQLSTPHDDLFFTYALKAQEFLVSSFTSKKGITNGILNRKTPSEINQLTVDPVYSLSAKVLDGSEQVIHADYNVYDPYTSQLIAKFEPASNNEVFICLPNNQNYRLEISRAGYSKVVKNINLKSNALSSNKLEEETFTIKKTATLVLNIYDNTIYEPLASRIVVVDSKKGTSVDVPIDSVGNGIYNITLPIGKSYNLSVSKRTFKTQTVRFDLSNDIYYYQFERDVELEANTKELEIAVSDSETKENLEVDIIVTNLDKNETFYLKARRTKDGKFKIKLREGDRYKVKVKNPKGYAYYTTDVDMNSRQETSKLEVDLVPLKAKTKLELKAITFETNSAELRQSSFSELKQVIELLLVNPELKVEISAHSDDKGSNAYNLKLSERRAQSVVSFLTEQGLPESKLVARGYGESKPLVPNDSEQNRAKNRRVELEILEKAQE